MRGNVLGLVALVFASSALGAQKPRPTLEVRTTNGRSTFRIGERIPLCLSFFKPEGQPYLVDGEPCGIRYCAGRWKLETFEVQPATGWSDPLEPYFALNSIVTGSRPSPQPPTTPLQVWLDLNEWVRFDEPGDYTVKIMSKSVASRSAGPDALVSSAIDLHIISASPEWQNERLQWARSNLDPYNVAGGEAEAVLRYLATPAAVDEMVSKLREELGPTNVIASCTMCMGIIGLPDPMRKIAVASMNRRIEEPDFPISPVFFGTMTFLRGGPACRGELRPACPYDTVLWLKVDSALPRKKAKARAETLRTLNAVGP